MGPIELWIDQCCVTGLEYSSGIRRLWGSFKDWLSTQPQDVQQRFLSPAGFLPHQGELRDALLAAGFPRGGYKKSPLVMGIAPRAS